MKLNKSLVCNMAAAILCGSMIIGGTSCSSFTNTGKGALIGGGGGGALGAGIGALIGGGKGAAIGAAVGAAVGSGAGALIGNKMDKQQKELQQQLAQQAKVEETTDENGLQAIKVTFDGGILFPTNGTTLSANAESDLAKFAASVNAHPGTNIQVYGFTDNTGSLAVNERVANGRAQAVLRALVNDGVSPTRVFAEGIPMADYVASNATAAGRAQNRRVEIYITAGQQMIQEAEAQAHSQAQL